MSAKRDTARPRVRPRFTIESRLSPDDLRSSARRRLREQRAIRGLVLEGRIELTERARARRLWSPQLTINVAARGEGSQLDCRLGPHPEIWTLYLAIHAVGAIGTLAAAILGISQHLSGQPPWGLWALPAAPVLAALVFAMAFVGQRLASEEMTALRRFAERIAARPDATPRVPERS